MKRYLGCMFFALMVLLCGCGRDVPGEGGDRGKEGPWQRVDTAMGTVIQQTVYGAQETAELFSEDVMEMLYQMEREELSWRLDTSQVYRINRSAGLEEGCALSEELAGLLAACQDVSVRSEGAFDVTLGRLTSLWNIDQWSTEENMTQFQIPSGKELEAAVESCGSSKMKIVRNAESAGTEPDSGRARIWLPEGMRLDLGAVGKGLALSRISRLLEEREEMGGAVISLGGSVLTYGVKPDGSPWKVGIVDPADPSSHLGILTLEGQWCVSTSGDYERYVEADGVRYHHILDPATGYPAQSGVGGVTVLVKDGLLSDGLSTACFILGPEQGMELAEAYGAETLFVMQDGSIRMSEGMETYFSR